MSHIIRAPLWLAQLVTGAKSFRDNPVIGSYRLNQMGLHALRRSSADRLGALRRRRLASPLTAAGVWPSFHPSAFATFTVGTRE